MSEGNFVLYGLLVMYIIFDKKYLQFWQYCGIINKIYINQRERMLNYGKNSRSGLWRGRLGNCRGLL